MPPLHRIALAATLSVTLGPALAVTVVDTKPDPFGVVNYVLDGGQSLAVTFSVDQPYTVHSIEGWMFSSRPGGFGWIHLIAGDTPRGSVLASSYFPGPTEPTGWSWSWRGVSGLDVDIGPGTYTAAFVSVNGFSASMPRSATQPLASEWYGNGSLAGGWTADRLRLGVRIEATPLPAVPEPGTAAFMALGLAALGFAGRRGIRAPG